MPGSLPPLKALHTFEVAARSLSFSKAAMDLNVTQGAVSKQIKLLEEFLGRALFTRSSSGLELTDAGREFLPAISESLETIRRATANLQQSFEEGQSLKLNLIPSFSSLWLMPRMAVLREVFPELNLTQVTGDGLYRFDEHSADLAIRCLPISKTIEHAELLVTEHLIPVIHPACLEHSPIETAEQLLNHPLLVHVTRPQLWPNFLRYLGISATVLPEYRHGFEHFYMSLEAAKQQQGIALIPAFMARDSLERGELISPLNISYSSGYGYYLLRPAYSQHAKLLARFRDWLMDQLAAPS